MEKGSSSFKAKGAGALIFTYSQIKSIFKNHNLKDGGKSPTILLYSAQNLDYPLGQRKDHQVHLHLKTLEYGKLN